MKVHFVLRIRILCSISFNYFFFFLVDSPFQYLTCRILGRVFLNAILIFIAVKFVFLNGKSGPLAELNNEMYIYMRKLT